MANVTRAHRACDDQLHRSQARIKELETELDGYKNTVQRFSKRFCLNHCAVLAGDRLRRSDKNCEMCQLQDRLAALDWSPITQDNLPRVGDEVLRYNGKDKPIAQMKYGSIETCAVDALCDHEDLTAADYAENRWLFRRPIHAPAPPHTGAGGKK